MRTAAAFLAAIVTLASLTACAAHNDPAIGAANTPSSSSTPASTGTPLSTPTDGLSDGADIPVAASPDATSTAAAIDVAEKLMTAFARPNIDATTWINGLYPYLTQQGGFAYEGTDPAKVPVSQVTGPSAVVDGATEYALLVKVPTNIGDFVVSLTRKTPTDPWLADRITPPTR